MILPGIFINYRREDSGGYALQLHRSIRSHFGAKLVFMDIDTIHSGEDYRAAIHQAIAQSNVFLAVIGRSWLHSTDDKGVPRLTYPADLVRKEITQALEAKIHVIPVLVGHAPMPRADQLPDDLRALAGLNAHEIPDRFFDPSVRQLIRDMAPYVRSGRELSRRRLLWAAGTVAATGLAGQIIYAVRHPSKQTVIQKATSARETKFAQIEGLIQQASQQPPVVVKKPALVESLPALVPGPWKIDRIDFSSRVNGPHRDPKVAWLAHVSIGDAWSIVGFAPDRTLFLYDRESKVVCGILEGSERWAYEAEDLSAVSNDGRIVLGKDNYHSGSFAFQCFNSLGEGGSYTRQVKLPEHLLSVSRYSAPPPIAKCEGGSVTLQRASASVPVDGNCSDWQILEDDHGRLYAGTDRGSLYCFDRDGKVLWTYKADSALRFPPLFSMGDPVLAVEDHLICVRDGALRWSLQLEGCRTYLVDQAGAVFVTHRGPATANYMDLESITAVDHDGRLLWSLPSRGEPMLFDPEGRLYVVGPSSDYVLCLT